MIRLVIDIYILILILNSILSYVPSLRGHPWLRQLRKVCDVTQDPIRKVMPTDVPVDLSPLVVILILNLVKALW